MKKTDKAKDKIYEMKEELNRLQEEYELEKDLKDMSKQTKKLVKLISTYYEEFEKENIPKDIANHLLDEIIKNSLRGY